MPLTRLIPKNGASFQVDIEVLMLIPFYVSKVSHDAKSRAARRIFENTQIKVLTIHAAVQAIKTNRMK